jgi:hypothetical protein
MEFYTSLIEWTEHDTSYVRVFWAWASHLGEALHKMVNRAKASGISDPMVCEADPYEFDNLPETAMTSDDGVTYMSDAIHSFPMTCCYNLPYGVIQSCIEGDHEAEDIVVGYELDDQEDLIQLSAVVEEESLLGIYQDLITVLTDIRVFWIKIHDDWEDTGKEEIYVNEELITRDKISEFIRMNLRDTLHNGHITITTYSEAGATNLNISDHKMIIVLTYEKEIAERISSVLNKCGISKREKLISVECGFHHWHYRHPEGLDRRDLISLLKSQGFSHWDPSESA